MSEELSAGTRRLPVYLVLDVSGSMAGEPIEALRMGIRGLLSDLQSDPQAMETVWMSVITFESNAQQVIPLTEIGSFVEPNLSATGGTNFGDGLELLLSCVQSEVRKTTATQKGDWKPLVFIMTDGCPTGEWEAAADKVKAARLGNVIGCAAGPGADESVLKRVTETVLRLENTSAGTLGAFLNWVSASISATSTSVSAQGDAPVNIPPPPADQGIVIIP